ncbi:E3 ubiquitin-protein ligase BRE1 [Hondaea fermentalgiana]|uniref:E3 ubiquitin-protein ligase BRE1 n=1 Tax=Hondaea fermentalgiana TaxID=2315210 RepID=A0A2R5GQ95_9STRA|nr:E3 ubiquitin-protein ligase BRE1 [Hondaea fermentalgiana]|eukprot:GBG32479.1 E3 ubiquitin-protein ligase BRE1 [Hondaea fermentalgiana]
MRLLSKPASRGQLATLAAMDDADARLGAAGKAAALQGAGDEEEGLASGDEVFYRAKDETSGRRHRDQRGSWRSKTRKGGLHGRERGAGRADRRFVDDRGARDSDDGHDGHDEDDEEFDDIDKNDDEDNEDNEDEDPQAQFRGRNTRRESSTSSGSLGGLRAGFAKRHPARHGLMNWKSFSSSARSLGSSEPPEEEKYRHEECVQCTFEVQDPVVAPCGHVFCRHCAWDRLVLGPAQCPTCEVSLEARSMTHVAKHVPLEPVPLTGIYDSVFVEFGRLGFKSFHFSRYRCYISYSARDGPEEWKTFDDGTPAPKHKDFDSFSFDETHRIFHGNIVWSPKTWSGGIAKVSYELIFDETYEYICNGTAVAFKADGTVHGVSHYGTDAKYRRLKPSIYTTDSIYLWDSTRPLLDSSLRRGWSPYKGMLRFSRWVAKTTMGIPNWMFQELVSDNVGLYGVGSLHFSASGSFINLSNVRGHSLPAVIPFTYESFDEATRVFEGDFNFEPFWFSGESAPEPADGMCETPMGGLARCLFVFDRELSKIVTGHVNFFRRIETGTRSSTERHHSIPGPMQAQSAPAERRRGCFGMLFGACAKPPPPEVVQERLQLIRSIEMDKDISYRLKNPWQNLTRRVYNMPNRNLMEAADGA